MIDGFTARSYLDGLESATGVDRNRMERELLEYADAEEEKEADHYKKLMTDDGYRDSLLKGNPVIEDAQKTAPQPNETPFEAANRGYLGWVEGRDSLGRDYFALRDAYANTHFGKYTVGDKEFYDLVRGSYETEDKQIAALNDLNQTTVREALEDSLTGNRVSLVDTVAKWKEKYPELVDEKKDFDYLAQAMELRAQTRKDLEGIAPHAAKIWDVLKRYQDGDQFVEGKADDADIQALGMELTRLTDPQIEQAKRYAVMAAQAQGDTDLSSLEKMATNLAQATSRSFGWAETPIKIKRVPLGPGMVLGIPTVAYTPLDILELNTSMQREKIEKSSMPEPVKTAELERLDQADRMAYIVRGLYDTAKNGIDPIKPVLPKGTIGGTIERIAYTNAASIGYMAAAGINPMLGTYAYARDEYETMRRQNPEMPAVLAAEVSVVSGGLQSFMDRWQISLFTKRLPLTGKFLTDFKRGVVTTAANIGVAYGMESAIEHLQDATSTGIQLLVSNLRADAPDQNVEQVMKDYMSQRVDVQLAMLPLGFLAGGVATVRDFKQAGLTDAELTRFGFGRLQREAIMTARDPDAAIRAEAPLRKQADIEKGIAMVEKDIKAAEKLQADPEMPTLEKVTLSDGTPEYHVRRNEGTVAPAEKRTVLTEADLAGKSVEITYVSPTDGSMQSVVKDATEAHAEVMKKEDAYSKLIDCLSR